MKFKSKWKLQHCKEADADHARQMRWYAHTNHVPNVICVSKSIWDLPYPAIAGVLAHEVGHLLAIDNDDFTEKGADKAIEEYLDVKIRYKDTKYGDNLEYLNALDADLFMSEIGMRLLKEFK